MITGCNFSLCFTGVFSSAAQVLQRLKVRIVMPLLHPWIDVETNRGSQGGGGAAWSGLVLCSGVSLPHTRLNQNQLRSPDLKAALNWIFAASASDGDQVKVM